MRFKRLDILRYGALTDRSLAFQKDARLHVIYGPNEAGKSSALSAISDLLFGFPERSAYGFQADSSALRVAALVAARDGSELSFRRRKGRKSTLLAPTETEEALPDDVLAPFLGTLSRDVFERAFGLNSASLRAGGESMLKSGGEIGSLLFSAASGLNGLSDMRKDLEAEADTIYAPRRSKDRLFYQVLDAHEEARKAERENELKAGDWKKLVAEQADLEAELQTVLAQRQETKRALEHLRQLLRLDPIIREIDRENEQLAQYAPLADLPAEFETELASLLERLRDTHTERSRSEAEKARLTDELAAIEVEDRLLDAAPAIMAAHSGIAAYVNARNDIARVRAEAEEFGLRLAQSARRLGLSDAADLQKQQPTDADLARVRALVEEGTALDRQLHQVRERIEEQRDALRRMEEGGRSSRAVDPKIWSEQLASLQPDLVDLQRMEALQVRVKRAEGNLADAATRLDPPVDDVGKLSALPLPDAAELAQHRWLIEEARREAAAVATKRDGLAEEAAQVRMALAALEGTGQVVSRDAILGARTNRDGLLQEARKQPEPAAFDRLASAISYADQLSDSALAGADRVTRHAQLTLRLAELDQSLRVADARAKQADIELSDAVTAFEDAFRPAGVNPSSPERMIEWRQAVEDLFRQLRELHQLRDEVEALRLKEEKLRPALMTIADATRLAAAALPTTAIARALERRLSEIAQLWTESRASETKRAVAEEAIVRLEERQRALLQDVQHWQSKFTAALPKVGLPEDADPAMALAALEAWRTVPDQVAERQNRERRVRGMIRDMEEFEQTTRQVVGEVAADLSAVSSDVAASLLHERLVAATAENKHRVAVAADLERLDATLARLAADRQALEQKADELAARLKTQVDALPQVLDDLRQRQHLVRALQQCHVRFAEHADGRSEEEIRASLAGFDRIAASLEIERLTAEEERLVERMRALGVAQAEIERRRRELETGIGAERAVFQKLAAEEEARELARRWVVLKLAASILATSMESYREQQADPVMKRAGELFCGLTGGRFTRLLQLYDEKDELQLAVERQNGEQVPLSGLSEGTGDQLYLALRLAFLEDYCRRNEPAPLVLDDIFQTFDDERTAAGLRTLAAASETHQTLLFTHQRSVVEAARQELGESADIVQL
ncbi:uncharacterized protein YhaN [Pseudorhizobium tarimense]|uniref:Uncharacterized protein YhaN n=1 Tax=Pseudorhizobium tarimense TaxID=1079109 RepID=A0ABV2H5I2_9HYPH|nr:YhaN family protein [Pseudorhizobium tarimense]MCJ8518890.1 AAA family ATPase [Pseudorhizobium tarimense]